MYSLPIVIPPEDDELLGSWIYRLSKANLFDTPDTFLKNFVRANASDGYQYIKYDDTEEFSAFYLATQSRTSMADLYLKTTCYAGVAPFLTSGQQTRRINLAFRKTYGKPEFIPPVNSMSTELRCCKQCQYEERESMGFWYYHRSHQLPGVRVCYKHGCLLNVYKGSVGHEFDNESPFKSTTPNAQGNTMQQYAAFVKRILDTAPDADISATKQAIKEELRQRGFIQRGSEYKALETEIEKYGMAQMFPVNMKFYITSHLVSSNYPSVEQTMAMAFFLFGTADAYIQALPQADNPKFWDRLEREKYQIVGSFRKNLVQLRHECGTNFCVTAEGFASGWSCPKCDSKKSSQDILDNLISNSGKGEYTLLSSFQGFNSKVALQHCVCGRTLNVMPRSFLFEGKRCVCESQKKKENLFKRLKSNDEFELIEYDSRLQHIFVRHLKCGKSFRCDCNHFLDDMRCPHCENGVRVGIKRRLDVEHTKQYIADIVGDEYTMESTTIPEDKSVMIRHNKCGRTQRYYLSGFLMGRRCSYCNIPMSVDTKKELVLYLSNCEYEAISVSRNGMCQLRNLLNGQERTIQFEYLIQELVRPTPSPILPCRDPNRAIDNFVPTPTDYYSKILACLKNTYRKNDVLFKEDFETFGADNLQMKRVTEKMVKEHVVERLHPGIYKWYGSDISENEVIFQRYICRKEVRIGYLYGHSFAYELGLLLQKPERIFIVTNQESNLHGRDRLFLGCKLYLRGAKIVVSEENWKILQLLDLLPNLSKYTDFDDVKTDTVLHNYIRKNCLTFEQAIPYLDLYPDWVGPKLKVLCREEK